MFNETKKCNLKNARYLARDKHGLERETLRVDANGRIAQTMHPKELGSSLTNPFIKTDFSEAQLEYATRPASRIESVQHQLLDLHRFVQNAIDPELMWPYSMPARLPEKEEEIPLGIYGSSREGEKKTVYRRGLGFRYGRRMQTISGVHYNFSFGNLFLKSILGNQCCKKNKATLSDVYLQVIRNFYRKVPALVYLFGASPVADRSFFGGEIPFQFENHKKDTLIAPYATSLRMSEFGYTSRVQDFLGISYNSVDEYTKKLEEAVTRKYPKYEEFSFVPGNQLNANFLQIENEFYSPIRPKQIPIGGERPLDAIRNRGIQYIEIRCLDVDPESPVGISGESLHFLHLMLLECLIEESPFMNQSEIAEIKDQIYHVVWEGRKPDLKIHANGKSRHFRETTREYLEGLYSLAERMDSEHGSNDYRESLELQIRKTRELELLPSSKVIESMGDKEFLELGLERAIEHRAFYEGAALNPRIERRLRQESERSLASQRKIELEEAGLLEAKVCHG